MTSTVRYEPQRRTLARAPRVMQLTNKAKQLLMAADATDNAGFVALVVGYRQDIENLHRKIREPFNLKTIHMRRLARKTKVGILQELDRVSPSSAAVGLHCLQIDFESQKEVAEKERPTQYFPTGKLLQAINRSAMEEIKRAVGPSLAAFNVGPNWSALTIEVDSDTERMVMTTGATLGLPGAAHELADAVAWSNHAGLAVKCIRHHNLVSDVTVRVRKRLRR